MAAEKIRAWPLFSSWDAVADEREGQLDTGVVQAVPLEVAIARLEARFPG